MSEVNDLTSMTIIANSGDARSFAFKALQEAKEGNYEEAEELLVKSEISANLAHKAQTELLFKEANGDKQEIDVLLIHSQDHLMTSMLAVELIKEIILLYKNK
ncbi:PTS lactose/cellobiose transporter subunit IIA [Clostridium intestinale]|jgi:PTS system cellobiose-specific IIA component|uniref:PTS system, cellobiose-specific IIA component n=1 Tax=Clostridium intestinale DSM 6191 TaxID=1121320 RepID=A0A1M5XU47_9CLOT|nr:PTS lactose/cellobiose transporter subunit IIA [Clostridium intestinale]SHI03320.1 PTS system, cellobiose-specific IIA component [Clostridium intestinale DSM 6191]